MVEQRPNARLSAYIDGIRRSAFTTWSEAGWDAQRSRFRERLSRTGQGLVIPHRSMVQARQIYVFANAARLGWFEDGARLAETAMASLLRDSGQDDEEGLSFAFSMEPASGVILSDFDDAYANAFVLFAIAALFELNHDQRLLDVADATTRFIQAQMADQVNGGLFDALPITRAIKRQNPHMHLLEAFLALEQAASGRGYAARALNLVGLFKTRFVKAPPGVLLEFQHRLVAMLGYQLSGDLGAGHYFEWVWLLTETQRLTNETMEPWIGRSYDIARRYGSAPDGWIYDELSSDFTVAKSSHRLWPPHRDDQGRRGQERGRRSRRGNVCRRDGGASTRQLPGPAL